MKKTILSRMFTIAIFCLSSIVIKSEATACKLSNRCTAQAAATSLPVKLASEETENNFYRPNIFLIKT